MRNRRMATLASIMDVIFLIALVGAAGLVFYTFAYDPAGYISLQSVHYTFRELHANGIYFYSLIAVAIGAWALRPSARSSTAGR